MRLALVLLVAGCVHVAMPPSAHMMPDARLKEVPYKILVEDYKCNQSCMDRLIDNLLLISP
jgi:hypothetical protein